MGLSKDTVGADGRGTAKQEERGKDRVLQENPIERIRIHRSKGKGYNKGFKGTHTSTFLKG